MTASKAPSRYIFGRTAKNNISDTDPVKANPSRKVFLKRPWSAAPDIDIMSRAWTSTLNEKVYMANEAVLISMPTKLTTQAGNSLGFLRVETKDGMVDASGVKCSQLALHGLVRSLRRTPWSLANCSRVMGRKGSHCADNEDFGRKAIAIPASKFFAACQSDILALVLWLWRFLHLPGSHVAVGCVFYRGAFIVALD